VFKLSEENRRKEYDRLIKLGRTKDIPESLTSEFGEAPISNPTNPPRGKSPNSIERLERVLWRLRKTNPDHFKKEKVKKNGK